MVDCNYDNVNQLELTAVIGINGKLPGTVKFHPNKMHLLFPVGNKVIIKNVVKPTHAFLSGHSNAITCLTVSKSGRYVVTGQINHMGFKTQMIIWDFDKQTIVGEHSLHRVKVQDVSVSLNDLFVASIGGLDDGNIVVYCLTRKEAILATPASAGLAGLPNIIQFANTTDLMFITAGRDTLRVWALDPKMRHAYPFNAVLGFLKREIIAMAIDSNDRFVFCGTKTGDILKVRINTVGHKSEHNAPSYHPVLISPITRKPRKNFMRGVPECLAEATNCFSQGITALELLKNGEILIGTGDGTICRATEEPSICPAITFSSPHISGRKSTDTKLKEIMTIKLNSGIQSLAIRGEGNQFYVGTRSSEIYCVNTIDFSYELLYTCHTAGVKALIFPPKGSDLFASCGENIRVWNTQTGVELLRICIPNMKCSSIQFMSDGQSIISGWNDGKVRAFTPETGKLMFTIHDAHPRGVTAVQVTSDCQRIISGGGEGNIRIWDLVCNLQKLKTTLREHRGPITSIAMRKNNEECISASTDGSCIIWDLRRFVRNQVVFANTMFLDVIYHPDECQILTCGADRKVAFWETFDGQPVREIQASTCGPVNSVDISHDGQVFVTGGNDKLVKMWRYLSAEKSHIGGPHPGDINTVKISPDCQFIISGSEDGSIFVWKFPA